MDKKKKSWNDLNKKEKSTVKGVAGASLLILVIEYWKISTPKQKFNIVFFWISLSLLGTYVSEGELSWNSGLATPIGWFILLRGLFKFGYRWEISGRKLEKGETFIERYSNHWKKQSISQKFWLGFSIFILLLFAAAILSPSFK
jgi:hypothetical protein